jgi:hypothetical protein
MSGSLREVSVVSPSSFIQFLEFVYFYNFPIFGVDRNLSRLDFVLGFICGLH